MFAYLRVFYRLILFALLVVIGLLITLLLFPLVGWQSKRRIIKTWSHWLLRALGIRLVVERAPPAAAQVVLQALQGLFVAALGRQRGQGGDTVQRLRVGRAACHGGGAIGPRAQGQLGVRLGQGVELLGR